MGASASDIFTISQLVQAAVAPVFLITGVATLLGALSTRQVRVLERARALQNRLRSPELEEARREQTTAEPKLSLQRAVLINIVFVLGSVSALVVSLVVVLLFYSSVASEPLAQEISVLFMAAMGLLILALLLFLREVLLATQALRVDVDLRR